MNVTPVTGIEVGVAIAVLLILVIAIALATRRRRKNPYGKQWAPLVPLIRGQFQGSRLAGNYQGLPVSARIAGDGGETPAYHYELTMTPGGGAGDWALSYTGEKFLGTGTKTWRVKSKEDALRQRLAEAGAVAAIQDWPSQPEVSFKSRSGTLHYWEPIPGPEDLPDPARFQAQLDLLARLARINAEVNRGRPDAERPQG